MLWHKFGIDIGTKASNGESKSKHYDPPSTQPCFQELILEKVRDDTTVRRKICQSSALRLKRGPHDLQAPNCEVAEPQPPPPGPAVIHNNINNNGPCSLKPEELALSLQPNTPGIQEERREEPASPDSLSDVSKFESEPAVLVLRHTVGSIRLPHAGFPQHVTA